MAIQKLFTSNVNNLNSADFVGEQTRLWYDPTTNSFYVSDGVTVGGIPVGTASTSGLPTGPTNSVQLNSGYGTFLGTANLEFANHTLAVTGNVTATNVTATNVTANTVVNNGTGNVYFTGNLLPTAVNYTLGTLSVPWGNAFFGPQSVTILDDTGNIGNTVTIENIAANITMGTAGFNIVKLGTSDSLFRIESLTGQIFSNAKTVIQNTTNADNSFSQGALQVKGGASVVKDFYVGGGIYGTADHLSNVVNNISVGTGLTQTAANGNVGIDATGVLSVAGTTNQIAVANVGQHLTLSLPQSISTNSTVTFANVTVTGNLTVSGTTTTANSTSIIGKVLYLANNSTSNTQIDSGGIVLGNTAGIYNRSILYNLTNDRWDTGTAGLKTQTLTTADLYTAGNLYLSGNANFGTAYTGFDYPNAGLQVIQNVNSYSQVIAQNLNNGTQASTDFVATNNVGNNLASYIDFGINSSTYADSDYAVTGANDGYLYVNGGDIAIGTQSAGTAISFFTGGTNSSSYIRAVVDSTGLTMRNSSVVVHDGNDNEIIKLQPDGNIVFNGGSTLNLNNGFHVSSVGTNAGDANLVNYVGGAFVYGPALTDYAGNLKANVFTASGNVTGGNIRTTGNVTGNYFIGNGSQLTGITSSQVTTALGFTPGTGNGTVTSVSGTGTVSGLTLTGTVTNTGNLTLGGTLSLTSSNVTTALGFTPYSNTNPAGYTTNVGTVTSVGGTGTVSGLTLTGTVTNTGNLTLGGALNLTALAGNISTAGNVTGNYFIGNGSQLTGLGVGINQLVYVLNATYSLTSLKNSLQSMFGLTNGVTLASNTRYEYTLAFNMQFSKAGALTYALALGSGVAIAQHNYIAQSNQTTTLTGYTAGITMMGQTATGATITTGTAIGDTTIGYGHYIVRGTIDVTTGGSVNFMISQDQITPITWSVLAGACVKLTPLGAIGANTVDGTWS